MNSKLAWSFWLATWCLAQTPRVEPRVVGQPVRDGHVTVLHLAPRYTSTVRMPEPVNSVAVGDPASFSAEHSEREPRLVFVKPITTKPAQSNLLITTTHGDQASLLLVSSGEANGEEQPPVDFVLRYRPAGRGDDFLDAHGAVDGIGLPAARAPGFPVRVQRRAPACLRERSLGRMRNILT